MSVSAAVNNFEQTAPLKTRPWIYTTIPWIVCIVKESHYNMPIDEFCSARGETMGDSRLLADMGLRVSQRRKAMHLTQEQVAEMMDVSVQMVSNLELGKKAIRPENLVKICKILDVSADYILTGRSSELALSTLVKKFASLSTEHQQIIGMLIDSL